MSISTDHSATEVEKTSIANKNAEKLEKLLNPPEEHEVKSSSDAEPEWMSYSFSHNDFVDLKGFDEEQSESIAKELSSQEQKQKNTSPHVNHNHHYNNNNNNNNHRNAASFSGQPRSYVNNNYPSYRNNNNNYGNGYNNNNHQMTAQKRFRNPLHQSKPANAPQYLSWGLTKFPKNPFYEVWRNPSVPSDKMNFSLMHKNPYQYGSKPNVSMMNMEEVEKAMKQRQMQCTQPADPKSIPLFFQNAANNFGVRINNMTLAQQSPPFGQVMQNDGFHSHVMPTQEQLQQHTSAIMRNAMLRKQQQQPQNHDDQKND
jgi:hypothetical protein